MNFWLLDASVLLAGEDADDDNHEHARRLLEGPDVLATLDLAFYETANVALRAWRDPDAGRRLTEQVRALGDDGGLVRADMSLLSAAIEVAADQGISVYDAAYVAAADASGAQLVSCDARDLVSRGLARLPVDALADQHDGGGT